MLLHTRVLIEMREVEWSSNATVLSICPGTPRVCMSQRKIQYYLFLKSSFNNSWYSRRKLILCRCSSYSVCLSDQFIMQELINAAFEVLSQFSMSCRMDLIIIYQRAGRSTLLWFLSSITLSLLNLLPWYLPGYLPDIPLIVQCTVHTGIRQATTLCSYHVLRLSQMSQSFPKCFYYAGIPFLNPMIDSR